MVNAFFGIQPQGLLTSLVLSAILVAILFRAVKSRSGNWWLLLTSALLVASVLSYPLYRIYSYHGFRNLNIVYQLLDGFLPPENPLLAGNIFHYPWAYHLLVGAASYITHIAPTILFSLVTIAVLLLTLVTVYKIAFFLFPNPISSVFSSCLAIYGFSFTSQNTIAEFLNKLFGFSISVAHRTSVSTKFLNINSMPLGFLFFSTFILSTMNIFSEATTHLKRYHFLLIISVIGIGLFYPQIVPVLILSCIAICAVFCFLYRRTLFHEVGRFILCIVSGFIILAPYLYFLSSGSTKGLVGMSSWHWITIKSANYIMYIFPMAIILLWQRRIFSNLFSPEKIRATLTLITIIVTTAFMYIVISVTPPVANEYKYLLLNLLSFGIIGGLAMNEVYVRNKSICFVIMVFFLAHSSTLWIKNMEARNWRFLDACYESGIYLRHKDPDQDSLYQWISNETSRDAIFIDSQLTIPVFGRRSLYVALPGRQVGPKNEVRDGWGAAPENMPIQEGGKLSQLVKLRSQAVNSIYMDSTDPIGNGTMIQLEQTTGKRDLYVVARDKIVRDKLSANNRFKKVFEVKAASVYLFLKHLNSQP